MSISLKKGGGVGGLGAETSWGAGVRGAVETSRVCQWGRGRGH